MVVPGFSEDPGGELDAEPGEAQQDLGVRVLREHLLYRLREIVSCGAGGFQLNEEGEHLLAEGVLDQQRLVGPVGPEDVTDAVGFRLDATLAAGPLEGGLELGAGHPRGPDGGRCGLHELAGFGAAEAVGPGREGVQSGGVVLPQQGTELVGELLPVPQRVLLSASEHGDRAAEVGVVGQRPVGVHVGAQDVRQHQGVTGVGLFARDAVPVAVAGRGHRVDRVHLPLAGPQHRHQQTTGRLDRHRDRVVFGVAVLGEQLDQDLVASGVIGNVPLGQ